MLCCAVVLCCVLCSDLIFIGLSCCSEVYTLDGPRVVYFRFSCSGFCLLGWTVRFVLFWLCSEFGLMGWAICSVLFDFVLNFVYWDVCTLRYCVVPP